MNVAVVLVTTTCFANIGKNAPVAAPTNIAVLPLSIIISKSPLFPTYKQHPRFWVFGISIFETVEVNPDPPAGLTDTWLAVPPTT